MESTTDRIAPELLAHLQQWVGRQETLHDQASAAPMRALSATLDREDPAPTPGTPIPPLWHWLYFLPAAPAREIGLDGHPHRGGFLPPVPLPRRMWAGGRLTWDPTNPLRVGDAIERVSRIESVTHKSGRTGDLLFVTVLHTISNAQGASITEAHDIVYRAAAKPGEAAPEPLMAAADAPWHRELTPDEVLLFRYSALTFNGHRIHYDRDYVTSVEGYPGLIVHGPLIATLLVDLVRRQRPQVQLHRFEFKAVHPTFDGLPMQVCGTPSAQGNSVDLWAHDHAGRLTMKASAQLAS